MSVISKNPFDLLGDDGDESPSPAVTKQAAPKQAAPAPAQQRNVPGAPPRGAAGARGRGNYPARGGRSQAPHTTSGDNAIATDSEAGFEGERVAPPKKTHRGPDAHTKGPRGNRPVKNTTSGGHSSRGGANTGKARTPNFGGERRQFERRSGTVPDSQKKVDQGWGANEGEAELNAEQQGEKDAEIEENTPQTPAAEGEDEAEKTAAPAAEAEPEEPEEVTKSYDQYLAEKAQAALDFGKKEARQVTETALEGTQFVREGIAEFFSGKEKTATKTAKPKKEKVYIEVDGQFANPNAGRGDRPDRGTRGGRGRGGAGAGRGGERGGRGFGGAGRGAPRGARGAARGGRGLDASDEKAFPALGA